jgi:hypothetical protein
LTEEAVEFAAGRIEGVLLLFRAVVDQRAAVGMNPIALFPSQRGVVGALFPAYLLERSIVESASGGTTSGETPNFEGERLPPNEGMWRYGSIPEQGSLSVACAIGFFSKCCLVVSEEARLRGSR